MKMFNRSARSFSFILCLMGLATLLACNTLVPGAATPTPRADWSGPLKAVAALQPNDIPDYLLQENPQLHGDEFDPNQYFTALTHVSMEPGYVLDYIYQYDGLGAYPLLFARLADQDPAQAREVFRQSGNTDPFMNHVKTDGTELGYYEWAALALTSSQFYLFWHANYNDAVIVPDGSTLEEIITANSAGDFGQPMDAQTLRDARALSLEPQISIGSDTVTGKLITFSKWGGFSERTYVLNKEFPHTVVNSDSKVVVPYDCGILF